MRAHDAGRLLAASAVGVLLAGGAAIGTAGTAAAAAPAVHTHVATDSCFGHDDWRCFGHGGFRFDHDGFRFDHRGSCFNHPGFCFGHDRFDHRFGNGSFVIVIVG
ncbi:hypothetical protein [Streptomyces sp. NPDC048710]|uniref:hypothetical protein n=1 Tax=unclassified Streptomyces TaxID=2593676 RepID=UPI00371A23CA